MILLIAALAVVKDLGLENNDSDLRFKDKDL